MAQAFNLTAQLNLRGPSNVRQIVSDVKKQLGTITGDIKFNIDPSAINNTTKLSKSLQQLSSDLSSVSSNATAAASAIKNFGQSINSISNSSNKLSSNINKTISSSGNLGTTVTKTAKNISVARTEMEEFGRQSALAIRRFAAFSAVTGVFFSLNRAINSGLKNFIEFDKELVRLQQVTGQSADGLKGLQDEITRLSTGLGVSSDSLIQVSSTLAQAGLSARETEQALKALALTELAPSFDDINQTVEGSIALMRQFGIAAKDLEKALGSVNSVAAAFAVESSDIIAAIQRTGGVFATASKGVSEGADALNEFIAVFTSVRATTRESAETIATGLRTIFTRIQRQGTIEALKEFGVTLTDAEGKFVGAYKAVQLLSEGLSSIDPRDIRFSQIVEELGGFRQIGKVIPLIQQFATAQDALRVAQAGQGSLAADAAKAQLSLANQIAKVREEFLTLIRSLGQSDTFQTLARGALTFASGLIKITDAVKGVLPSLAILAAGASFRGLSQFTSGFIGGLKKVPKGGPGAQQPQSVVGSIGRNIGSSLVGAKTEQVSRDLDQNSASLDKVAGKLDLLISSLSALNIAGAPAGSPTSAAGVSIDPTVFNDLRTSINNLRIDFNILNNSLTLNSSKLQDNTNILSDNNSMLNSVYAALVNLDATLDRKDLGGGGGPTTASGGGRILGFSKGGTVPGSGKGDKVPALLEPGEVVMSNRAVNKYGRGNLVRMNRYAKGSKVIDSIDNLTAVSGGTRIKLGIGGIQESDEVETTIIPEPITLNQNDFNDLVSFIKQDYISNIKQYKRMSANNEILNNDTPKSLFAKKNLDLETLDLPLPRPPANWAKGNAFQRLLIKKYGLLSGYSIDSNSTFPEIVEEHFAPLDFESGDAKFEKGVFKYFSRNKQNDDKTILVKRLVHDQDMLPWTDGLDLFTSNYKGKGPLKNTSIYYPENPNQTKSNFDKYYQDKFNQEIIKNANNLNIPMADIVRARNLNSGGLIQKFAGGGEALQSKLSTIRTLLGEFYGSDEQLISKSISNSMIIDEARADKIIANLESSRSQLPLFKKLFSEKSSSVGVLNGFPIARYGAIGGTETMRFDELKDEETIREFIKRGKLATQASRGPVGKRIVYGDQKAARRRFAVGGTVQGIAAEEKKSIETVILEQLSSFGDASGVKKILGLGSGDREAGAILNAGNIKAGKNIEKAIRYINRALAKTGKQNAAKEAKEAAMRKVAIAGLFPLDYNKDFSDWKLEDGREIYGYVRGFQSSFLPQIEAMQEANRATRQKFAEDIQDTAALGGLGNRNIQGPIQPLAIDFDETLALGTKMLDENGEEDLPAYSDRKKVMESLAQARPTSLAKRLASIEQKNPGYVRMYSRILTARPQSTADIIASTLNRFGLPYLEQDVTGVSQGLGTNIAKAKAADVARAEKLIDDNEENIRATMAAGKSTFRYGEVPELKGSAEEKFGQSNIEGGLLEAALSQLLGYNINVDALQRNRAIDFPQGLGRGAQLFGLPPNIETEVKRTLDGDSFSKAREEFSRYFKENPQAYAKGGVATFGSGAFKFPKRISNAYVREMEKLLEQEQMEKVFSTYPGNERMVVDEEAVKKGYESPFTRELFINSFKDKINRNTVFERMGQFARVIGLPPADLLSAIPTQLDFGVNYPATALFSKDPSGPGTRGLQGVDLTPYGYTEQDKQDLFGYTKLIEEKKKQILKTIKTPVTTYEDGSFSYDTALAEKLRAELDDLQKQQRSLIDKNNAAIKAAKESRLQSANQSGRGSVGIATNPFNTSQRQDYSILYHELTHQLFNSLRTKNAQSFEAYRAKVASLFDGNNDDVADAFDALVGNSGYNSADVAYGRSYKLSGLSSLMIGSAKESFAKYVNSDPEYIPELRKTWGATNSTTNAKAFKPLNPRVNDVLLRGKISQDVIDKYEDNGKEEFLTTLVQKLPLLDENLSGILDSTLNDLLGGAGISRQKFATGGPVTDIKELLFGKKKSKPSPEELLAQYKKVLSSILPKEMLTEDGLLKTPTGQGEKINISTVGQQAYYSGALPFKAMRYQIEQAKPLISKQEYSILKDFIDQNIIFETYDTPDTIEVGGAKHKGVLAHETFHDIQGYLYDYYPEIMGKLFASIEKQKDSIQEWYENPDNKKWTGPGNYQLTDILPNLTDRTLGEQRNIGKNMAVSGFTTLQKAKVDPSRNSLRALGRGSFDVGRNEAIPVLLGAASEGSTSAAKILEQIFADTGLKSDFYQTLPRFASGGTVPALVSNGEAYVPPKLAKRIGYGTLGRMNQADKNGMGRFNSGGISIFKGPGSGTSDSIPTNLPVGSFIIREKATKALGLNSGGIVGIRRFKDGDKVSYGRKDTTGIRTLMPDLGFLKTSAILLVDSFRTTEQMISNSYSAWQEIDKVAPILAKTLDRYHSTIDATLDDASLMVQSYRAVVVSLAKQGKTTAEVDAIMTHYIDALNKAIDTYQNPAPIEPPKSTTTYTVTPPRPRRRNRSSLSPTPPPVPKSAEQKLAAVENEAIAQRIESKERIKSEYDPLYRAASSREDKQAIQDEARLKFQAVDATIQANKAAQQQIILQELLAQRAKEANQSTEEYISGLQQEIDTRSINIMEQDFSNVLGPEVPSTQEARQQALSETIRSRGLQAFDVTDLGQGTNIKDIISQISETKNKAQAAATANDYLALRARLAGQSLEEYSQSLSDQALNLAEQFKNNLPRALDSFQEQLFDAKQSLENISAREAKGEYANQEGQERKAIDISQLEESIGDTLENILGENFAGDSNKILKDIMDQLKQGATPTQAFNVQSLTDAIKNISTDEAIVSRAATMIAAQNKIQPEQIKGATGEALKSRGETQQLFKEIDKISAKFSKFGLAIGAAGSVIAKFIDATESRNAAMAAAAISSGTSTASTLAVGIGQSLQTLKELSTSTIFSGTGIGKLAGSVLPGLTKVLTGPFGIAATAAISLAAAFKDAYNAAREFDKELASKKLQTSLDRISILFDEFSKDMTKLSILKDITDQINVGISAAMARLKIDTEVPAMFWTNIIDAMAFSGSEATQRSMILQQQGVGAYLQSTTLGNAPIGMTANALALGIPDAIFKALSGSSMYDTKIFSNRSANEQAALNRQSNMFALAPGLAQQQSAMFKPLADNIFRVFEQQMRSGQKSEDEILASIKDANGNVSQFADTIARSNPIVAQQIIETQARADLDDDQRKKIIDGIIAREAEKQIILNNARVAREIEFEKLNKGVNTFVNSMERIYSNMEMSINKASFKIQQLSNSAELATASLNGNAKAGQVNLKAINVLQNRGVYSQEEQDKAVNFAGSFFGSASQPISSILNIGAGQLEDTILQTINRTRKEDPNATNEKVLARIRSNLDKQLRDLQIPDSLVPSFSKQIQSALKDISTKGDLDQVNFDEIAEKVPGLTKQIEAAKRAQESAVRAMEFYQNAVNEYANAMNTMIDLQLEANQAFNKASDIITSSNNELSKVFGREISLRETLTQTLDKARRQTGGETDPVRISRNIQNLENSRQTLQQASDSAAAKGPSAEDEFKTMQDRLRNNNLALRQNFDALKNLAESSEIASAALAKIQEIQAKRQSGANLIEKIVTSNSEELNKFNSSLNRLDNNMRGIVNRGTTAEQRSESLQSFNMIAPLLGEGAKQNELRANVLESMLLESGQGVTPMFAQVLDSLRNPEGDPEMQEAISVYKQGVSLQASANARLGEIKELMSENTAKNAAEKLKVALQETKFTFEEKILNDIRLEIINLKNLVANNQKASGFATGGIVYASNGASIDFAPKGTDTVPAMLTPGEFVVNRASTRRNLPLLQSINSSRGGKINYLQDGGIVPGENWTTPDKQKLYQSSERDKTELQTSKSYPEVKKEPKADDQKELLLTPARAYKKYTQDIEFPAERNWFTQKIIKKPVPNSNFNIVPGSSYVGNSIDVNDKNSYMYNGLGAERIIKSLLDTSKFLSSDEKPITKQQLEKNKPIYKNILNLIDKNILDKDITTQDKFIPRIKDSVLDIKIPRAFFGYPNSEASIDNLAVSDSTKKYLLSKDKISESAAYPINLSRMPQGVFSNTGGGVKIENLTDYKSAGGSGGLLSDYSQAFADLSITKQNYANLERVIENMDKEKFVASSKFQNKKTIISLLEDFANKKLFSIELGDEDENILDGQKAKGKLLPLTLYNIGANQWQNQIDKFKTKLEKSKNNGNNLADLLPINDDFKADTDNFIDLIDLKTGNRIDSYPWLSKDFNVTDITHENFVSSGKSQFGPKPQKLFDTLSPPIEYGKEKDLAPWFFYRKITRGTRYDTSKRQFVGEPINYYVIDKQDNNRSPFGEMSQDKLFIPENQWQNFNNQLKNNTNQYDNKTGKLIGAEKTFKYMFADPMGGFDSVESELGNQYKSVLQDFVPYIVPSVVTDMEVDALKFKENLKDRAAEVFKNEAVDTAKTKPKIKLETGDAFTNAKKVGIARAVYDIGKKAIGIKSAKPAKLEDVRSIIRELNDNETKLSKDLSKTVPDQRLTNPEWLKNYAYRAFFVELYKGTYKGTDLDTPQFLKGLGLPINNKYFTDPKKSPQIPVPGFKDKKEAAYVDYLDPKSAEGPIKNIINREIALKSGTAFAGTLSDEDKEKLKISGSQARIYEDGGDTLLQGDKELVPQSYKDVMDIGLNPRNVFATPTFRSEKYLSVLEELYKKGTDQNGNLVFDYGDPTALTAAKSIDILKEWYTDYQDKYLNLGADFAKSQEELSQPFNKNNFDGFRRLTAQPAHAFLTGNKYGVLPDSERLFDQLQLEIEEPINKARGGLIYASTGRLINFQPKGTDTVPAMLTPGEFVINRAATKANLPLLKAINSGSKGYSKGGIIYAAGGMHLDTDMTSDSSRRDNRPSPISPTLEEIAPGVYTVDPSIWKSDAPRSMRNINLEDLERNKFSQDDTIPYTNVTWAELAYAVEETRRRQDRQKARENSTLTAFGISAGESTVAHLAASQAAGAASTALSPMAAAPPWGTVAYALAIPIVYGATYAATSFGMGKLEEAIGVKERFDEIKEANPYATTAGSIVPMGASLAQAGYRAGVSGIVREAQTLTSKRAWTDRAVAAIASGASDAGVQVLTNAGEMIVTSPDDPHVPKSLWELNTNQILAAMVGGATFGRAQIREARTKWAEKIIQDRISQRMPASGRGGTGAFGYGQRQFTAEDVTQFEKAAQLLIGDDVINRDMLRMAGIDGEDLKVFSAIRASRENNFPEQYTNTQQGETPTLSKRTISGGSEGISPRTGLPGAIPENMDARRPGWGNQGLGYYTQEDVRRIIAYLQGNVVAELQSGKTLDQVLSNVSVLSNTLSPEAKLLVQKASKNFENQPVSQELLDKLNANISKFAPAEPLIPPGTIQEQALNTYLEKYRRVQIEDPLVGAAMPTMEQVAPVRVAYPNKIDPKQTRDMLGFRGISGEIQPSGLDIAFSDPNAFIKMQETTLQTLLNAAHQGDQAVAGFATGVHNTMMTAVKKYLHDMDMKSENVQHHQAGGLIYANNGRLINFKPRGTDTVPAMLTPGEFVVNRDSTQKYKPVLEAINNGNYSRGGIVNYLNKGGYIPEYKFIGGLMGSAGSATPSFDFTKYLNSLVGAVSSSITEAFDKALSGLKQPNNAGGGVSNNGADLASIDNFVNRLNNIANILSNIYIPPQITITGKHDVVVTINGDTVLNQLRPDIAGIVISAIRGAFADLKAKNPQNDTIDFNIDIDPRRFT